MVAAAIESVKAAFSEAIEIAHPSFIAQRGLYLFLGGVEPREQISGIASILLIVAENSLAKQTNSAAAKVDEVVKKITEMTIQKGEAWSFGGVKAAVFEGSTLFTYAVEIKIEA